MRDSERYPKGRSIMAGRLTFRIRDKDGAIVGHTGRALSDDKKPLWFFPKNYRQEHVYNLHRLENAKWAILTADAIDCAVIHSHYPNRALALLNQSMTKEQEFLLAQIRMIYLLHPEPGNISVRLCRNSLVKSPKLIEAIRRMTKGQVEQLLK